MDTFKDKPGLKTPKVPGGMVGRHRLANTFLMQTSSLSPGLQDAKAAEKAAKKAKAAAKLLAAKEAKKAEATRGAAGTRKSKAKAEADVKKVRRTRAQPDCSCCSCMVWFHIPDNLWLVQQPCTGACQLHSGADTSVGRKT